MGEKMYAYDYEPPRGDGAKSVWIVDDDRSIRWVLEKALAREGIPFKTFSSAYEVLQALAVSQPQVLVSDIRMPGESGLVLLNKVKERYPQMPVIIMTAYSDLDSAVAAFQGGAFEYLPKPFHLKEFIIRVRHVLGRQRPTRTIRTNEYTVDFDALSVEGPGGEKAFLQRRDAHVLQLLVQAAPRVVDRSEILDRVWGEDHFPTPRAVDNTIVRLRQALRDDDGRLIRSVRGVGYQWTGDEPK